MRQRARAPELEEESGAQLARPAHQAGHRCGARAGDDRGGAAASGGGGGRGRGRRERLRVRLGHRVARQRQADVRGEEAPRRVRSRSDAARSDVRRVAQHVQRRPVRRLLPAAKRIVAQSDARLGIDLEVLRDQEWTPLQLQSRAEVVTELQSGPRGR